MSQTVENLMWSPSMVKHVVKALSAVQGRGFETVTIDHLMPEFSRFRELLGQKTKIPKSVTDFGIGKGHGN